MTSKAKSWIPAFAGMTSKGGELDSGFRRNDEQSEKLIPAFAGRAEKVRALWM
jgi:hypothetical protein